MIFVFAGWMKLGYSVCRGVRPDFAQRCAFAMAKGSQAKAKQKAAKAKGSTAKAKVAAKAKPKAETRRASAKVKAKCTAAKGRLPPPLPEEEEDEDEIVVVEEEEEEEEFEEDAEMPVKEEDAGSHLQATSAVGEPYASAVLGAPPFHDDVAGDTMLDTSVGEEVPPAQQSPSLQRWSDEGGGSPETKHRRLRVSGFATLRELCMMAQTRMEDRQHTPEEILQRVWALVRRADGVDNPLEPGEKMYLWRLPRVQSWYGDEALADAAVELHLAQEEASLAVQSRHAAPKQTAPDTPKVTPPVPLSVFEQPGRQQDSFKADVGLHCMQLDALVRCHMPPFAVLQHALFHCRSHQDRHAAKNEQRLPSSATRPGQATAMAAAPVTPKATLPGPVSPDTTPAGQQDLFSTSFGVTQILFFLLMPLTL